MKILILFGIFHLFLFCQASEDWCYTDPLCAAETWGEHYGTCDGYSQSPINIITSETLSNPSLGPLQITGAEGLATAVVTNNGHTVEVSLSSEHILSRAGLPDPYRLAAFHIHFGNENSANLGSEHQIDSQAFPLEVHFVFYNTKYGDLETAKGNSDGLSVVGVLFQLGETSRALTPFINALPQVAYKGQSTSFSFDLTDLLPFYVNHYYTYQGSLTTPPCSEIVTWHVLKHIQKLDYEQYAAITRSLHFTTDGKFPAEEMKDNFRPVQPLNGRAVYRY